MFNSELIIGRSTAAKLGEPELQGRRAVPEAIGRDWVVLRADNGKAYAKHFSSATGLVRFIDEVGK